MAKHRGIGMATIEYPTGMNQNGDPSQAWIKVKPDGRIDVYSGTSEIGNGAITIQTQIIAETVGVPLNWVTWDNHSTDSSPVCTGTFASRATFVAGNAVRNAAADVKARILEMAAEVMEVGAEDLEIEDGMVSVKGAPDTALDLSEIAGAATYGAGRMLTGSGAHITTPATITDPETGEVDNPPHSAISYAGCVAEVEVDDVTGEVTVIAMNQAYDVGKAINPTQVEGQIEGGALMGIGLALLEESYPYYPSTEHRGSRFGQYLAPTMDDLPELECTIIESPSVTGPFGAKAIGEMSNNSQPPAIAIAIHDAVGVWVTELPITPERVLKAIEVRDAGEADPHRDGKYVIFDRDVSINSVGDGSLTWVP